MNAYLGDFGISSLILDSRFTSPGNSSPNSPIGLKGTIGYIAPEYAQCAHASTYGDVYSFGIILLEMLTGKRPTDPMFQNELNIVNFVENNFPEQTTQTISAVFHLEILSCKYRSLHDSEKTVIWFHTRAATFHTSTTEFHHRNAQEHSRTSPVSIWIMSNGLVGQEVLWPVCFLIRMFPVLPKIETLVSQKRRAEDEQSTR